MITEPTRPAAEGGADPGCADLDRAGKESARGDRRPSRRFDGVARFILTATCIIQAMAVFAQQQQVSIIAGPGDAGSISIPIANNPLSFSPDNVTITVSAPPGLDLQTQPSSQLGPSPVAPGTTVQFLLNYQIGPNATSGNYMVTFHPTYAGSLTYLDPPGGTLDTSVSFTTSGADSSTGTA